MSEANKAAIRRYYEDGLNKGNVDLMVESSTANIVMHRPGDVDINGHAGVRELVGNYLTAFPGCQLIIEDQIAEGDQVATRAKFVGTHKGDLQGIAATGKTVSVSVTSIDRFEGGKLAENWQNFDELAMLQQLGAVPAGAGSEKK